MNNKNMRIFRIIGSAGFLFGAFRRGHNPPVQPGVKKDFSKAKTGELEASPKELKENQTSKYNSSGLAAALLKYKEVQFYEKR